MKGFLENLSGSVKVEGMSEEGMFVGKGRLSGEMCRGTFHCGDGRHWEARDRGLLSTYCT